MLASQSASHPTGKPFVGMLLLSLVVRFDKSVTEKPEPFLEVFLPSLLDSAIGPEVRS